MKSSYLKLLFINSFLAATVSVQAADLVLQREITPDYIDYLTGKETAWLEQVAGDGDVPETMKAHMGLAVLAIAWSHVDADSQLTDLEPILEDISQNGDSIVSRLEEDLLPILFETTSQDEFFNMLIAFFESGDYVDFRDSVSAYLDNIAEGLDESATTLDSLFRNLDDNFSAENFQDHLDAIRAGTADFEFSVQIVGSEYEATPFVFSRTFFNRWEALEDLGRAIGQDIENGSSWMDSVMAILDSDVMPGIAYYRDALDKQVSYLDSLKVLLSNDPFTPFAIDISPLDSLQEALTEVDTLLGGKEYDIGPTEEEKTIKPLAIIQNLPGNGLWYHYLDFYRSSDPANYTFGGIFPYGLPTDALEFISADAIVNEADDEDTFYNRLTELKAGWLLDIEADPEDPDAHLGVALVLFYEMIRNNKETYNDVFRLLEQGRIDSLAYYYDWSDVDLFDEIAEIDDHLGYYVDADKPVPFIILVKTNLVPVDPYAIGEGSEFDIVQLWITDVAMARAFLTTARDAAKLLTEGLGAILDELSDIFIFDLNPAVLDFSQVDSDTALILMLETSNPDFLTLTPYGVEQFHKAGDRLKQTYEQLGIFFDHMTDLAHAVAPYEDDFGIDSVLFISEMESTSDAAWELYDDFAHPDSVTIVEGERVNFSAWFDNPPPSFLLMWKNYVFGIDSTLGGLFPDRWALGIETDIPELAPKEFALHPNYPNPFNPTTRIVFDMPKGGKVSLAIYNIQGQEVTRLVDEYVDPGRKVLTWDARGFSSGIYICRLVVNDKLLSNKMMLIK